MTRLIDADALKETMKKAVVRHICTNTLYNTIMAVIDGAPTVEADRPHGEWIFDTDISIGGGRTSAGYVCSNCRKDYFRVDGFNFCPNCGAKMRKGGDDE